MFSLFTVKTAMSNAFLLLTKTQIFCFSFVTRSNFANSLIKSLIFQPLRSKIQYYSYFFSSLPSLNL